RQLRQAHVLYGAWLTKAEKNMSLTQPTPARLALLLALLATLFAAALAIGKATTSSGTVANPVPLPLHSPSGTATSISAPPISSDLPSLRRAKRRTSSGGAAAASS